VVHDARAGGEHNVAKLTRGQQVVDLLLNIRERQVEARADHAALVHAAQQLDHDFPRAVVVDDLKVTNVL
jgi:hypothetical protein